MMVLQKDRGVGLGVNGQVCERIYINIRIRIYEIYIEIYVHAVTWHR